MKRLYNEKSLSKYIKKYNLNEIFETNFKSYMELHGFDVGEYIYTSDEEASYLYFLVKGKAKVSMILKNGKSLLLRFYNPLEVIGEVQFADGGTAITDIEAVYECECIGISLQNLRKYANNDPTFLRYISKRLSKKLINSSVSSAINLLYPLESRLASYILAISPKIEKHNSIQDIKVGNLVELADLLGTSYRHLIRVINNLCEQKIIEKQDSFLIIKDRAILESMSADLYI